MTCIENLLSNLRCEVEDQVKPALGRLLVGGIVRGYLPQLWMFKTECETVGLSVDSCGNASISTTNLRDPDVTITTTHAILSTILSTRSRSSVPPGPYEVLTHTQKGRTAFNYLRGRLGL
jgi:hypothetical protein